jgi:predicted DNA-binding protein
MRVSRGRPKVSERMIKLNVVFLPHQKRLLLLEAVKYAVTPSEYIRAVLTNHFDLAHSMGDSDGGTVLTSSDPTHYFRLWGHRFAVLFGIRFELLAIVSKSPELIAMAQGQHILLQTRADELGNGQDGVLRFSVPAELRERIEKAAKGKTMSKVIRAILTAHLDHVETIHTIFEQRPKLEEFASREEIEREAGREVLALARQMYFELTSQALHGVRAGERFFPTQLKPASRDPSD